MHKSQILRIETPNVACAKRRTVSRSRSFGSSRNAPPSFGDGLVGAGGRQCDEEESGNVLWDLPKSKYPREKHKESLLLCYLRFLFLFSSFAVKTCCRKPAIDYVRRLRKRFFGRHLSWLR